MGTELTLVRHGQTEWNAAGRCQGQQGSGLNQKGRAQAEEAARQLVRARKLVEAVYTSDLDRALETAQIIAADLDAPVLLDPRLREMAQGEWEGRPYREFEADYAQFRADPLRHAPPGGETLLQVARRVKAALYDIAGQHPEGNVVIVSHEVPIAIARCIARGRAVRHWLKLTPENCEAVALNWPVNLAVILTPEVARRRRMRRMRRGFAYPYRKARRTARVVRLVARYNTRRTLRALGRLLGS